MFGLNKMKIILTDLWPSILATAVSSLLLFNKVAVLIRADKIFFADHYMNHQGAYGFWYWCSILSLWFPLLWLYLRPHRLEKIKYTNTFVYSAVALAIFAVFLMFKMDSVI